MHRNPLIQVNLFQKHLFLHQLTHNMTTDCSLNYKFNTCSPHVGQKEKLLTKNYIYNLWLFELFYIMICIDACLKMKQSWDIHTQFSSLHLEAQYHACIILGLDFWRNPGQQGQKIDLLKCPSGTALKILTHDSTWQ